MKSNDLLHGPLQHLVHFLRTIAISCISGLAAFGSRETKANFTKLPLAGCRLTDIGIDTGNDFPDIFPSSGLKVPGEAVTQKFKEEVVKLHNILFRSVIG